MSIEENPKTIDAKKTSSLGGEATEENDLILRQLQAILGSPNFYATEQQKNFLNFVVNESLAGRSNQLKGYTVATQVFGRSSDFDASLDPIVSIQANKLRRALEHYYLTEGKQDSILIDIPKGTYAPVFEQQKNISHKAADSQETISADLLRDGPTLLILPFVNQTGDPDKNYIGIGLAAELASEMSSFQNMTILFPRDGLGSADIQAQDQNVIFRLTGDVFNTSTGIRITVSLVDTRSNQYMWGDTFEDVSEFSEIVEFQDNIVKIIAAKISGDFGIISRLVTSESRHKPSTKLSTYEAILRCYEYEQNISPDSFTRSMEALNIAAEKDPNCGRIWASLSFHFGTIYNLDIPGFEKPLEKAVEYAEKAALLDPHCQRAIGTLALIRFYSDELAIAIDEVYRAIDLNPNSLFVLDGLAYILILSGDWDHGAAIAQKVIKANPFHRAVLHDALWVNYLRLGSYNYAYHEAMHGRRPWLFWDPLIKASTLGLLGNEPEGQKYAEKLLKLRPDFPVNGRKLIQRYVKFEEIAGRIEQGLEQVGVQLD